MKKFVVFLGIIGAIALVLMITTPDRQQHADTIKSVVTGAVNAELRDNHIEGDYGSIASAYATNAIDQFLNTRFMVRNHRFYSLGFIDYDEQFIMVSLGIFNHVFTLDENQARAFIKEGLQEYADLPISLDY